MNEELKKPYNPAEQEELIYKRWEESGFFNPDVCIEKGIAGKNADYFSMVLPPPNVTGTLHTGHSLMLAIQDIMVRYNRMLGKKTLWIPGTDHAAIATESVVVKRLAKEKKTPISLIYLQAFDSLMMIPSTQIKSITTTPLIVILNL